MKKRILAFAAALLMLLSFSVSALAVSAMPLSIMVKSGEVTEAETKSVAAAQTANVLASLQNFWRQHGLVIVVVLVLICIVVAITISEMEQEKKRRAEREKKPHKKHEK